MSSEDLGASVNPQENVEDMIEHLRCHYCKGYLSCSPLRVLPDGHSICSRCEPPNNDLPVYRMLAMENALAKVTFPCHFQKNGCSMRMLFGHISEHERVCEYKPFTCFAATLASCSWKGQSSEISKHFSEKHQAYWMGEEQLFRIVVKEDSKQDLLVFEKQNVLTVFQYSYNSAKKILEYCIQYMPLDAVNPKVFYDIELHNIVDRTLRITIKTVPCLYQQTHASAPKKLSNIILESSVDILKSPDIIVFSVNMMFEGVITRAFNSDLNFLKCALCGIYATPPLFKDSEGELVCTDCGQKHKDCSSYEDEKLEKFMGEVNYPCRWARCNVTRKIDSIRQHEMNCLYRTFNCVVVDCNKIYKRGQVLDHFKKYHRDYSHFKDSFKFHVGSRCKKNFFMVKDDQGIIIEFNKLETSFVFKQTPSFEGPYISAYIQHIDCGWRSKNFCLPQDFHPRCCFDEKK